MGWKLWLDDQRDPQDWLVMDRHGDEPLHSEMAGYIYAGLKADDFVWAKDVASAMALVEKYGLPEYMALDYNLGSGVTVDDFLDWLEPMATGPIAGRCHSADWTAHRRVREILARFGKASI